VFLLSLTSCKTAGNLVGNLDVDGTYVQAGNYKVTKGELWNELKWNASTELTSKFNDVITKEYSTKIELVMDKTYSTLSAEEKEEQQRLRQEYIMAIRRNLRGTLQNVSIMNPDGTITDLSKKEIKEKELM
jgi:uncharacterized protein YnzC (UPF0291/DUF896 family)